MRRRLPLRYYVVLLAVYLAAMLGLCVWAIFFTAGPAR